MAHMQIFADSDEVFQLLMEKLGFEIPEFKLERFLKIELESDNTNSTETYTVSGVDGNLNSFDYLKEIKVNGENQTSTKQID